MNKDPKAWETFERIKSEVEAINSKGQTKALVEYIKGELRQSVGEAYT